jgi:hypothetical protein
MKNGPRSPKWTRGKMRGESLTNCLTSFLADLTHVDEVYHIYDWAVIPVIRRFRDGGFSHRFTFCHLNMDTKKNLIIKLQYVPKRGKNIIWATNLARSRAAISLWWLQSVGINACDRNSDTRPFQVVEKVLCKRLTWFLIYWILNFRICAKINSMANQFPDPIVFTTKKISYT